MYTKTEHKIYLDIDGTIADFDGAASILLGRPFNSITGRVNGKLEDALWIAMKSAYWTDGPEFWYSLNLLPDAPILLDYLSKHEIEFLTATSRHGPEMRAEDQKRRWVKERFGDVRVSCVIFGEEKAQFAKPNYILIDDTIDVIEHWRDAGGIGILHTSAADTIQQLKEIGV